MTDGRNDVITHVMFSLFIELKRTEMGYELDMAEEQFTTWRDLILCPMRGGKIPLIPLWKAVLYSSRCSRLY